MKYMLKILKHFVYYRHRYNLYAKTKYVGLDGERVNWLKKLNKEGIVVLEEYFKTSEVEEIQREIKKSISIGEYEKLLDLESYGVKRFLLSDKTSITANRLVFNEFFDLLGRNYIGGKGKRFQIMYEEKGGFETKSIADDMHFDDWKKRFKIFVYLNDVGIHNCPFHFYPNTKNNSFLRFLKECEYVLWGRNGSFGYYTDRDENRMIDNGEVASLTVTGKRGTVILCDTSHLHRGTVSKDGSQRLLLGAYYAIR